LDKIQAFVSLFAGNKLDIVALADFAKKDAKKIESLKRTQILKAGGLLTINDFVGKDEGDIEDLFEPVLFATIVNSAYVLTGTQAMTAQSLDAADTSTVRQVKKAEAFFRVLPQTVPEFDHFTPSSWLIEHPAAISGDSQEVMATLDRAEALFRALNSLRES